MKNDYYVDVKFRGELIGRVELLAFTNYQAKKELLREWMFLGGDCHELVNCKSGKTLLSI